MNKFSYVAKDYRELYEAFIESGFTEEQAWELMTCYVRQSVVDNILADKVRRDRSEVLRRRMAEPNFREPHVGD